MSIWIKDLGLKKLRFLEYFEISSLTLQQNKVLKQVPSFACRLYTLSQDKRLWPN